MKVLGSVMFNKTTMIYVLTITKHDDFFYQLIGQYIFFNNYLLTTSWHVYFERLRPKLSMTRGAFSKMRGLALDCWLSHNLSFIFIPQGLD